MSWSCECEKKTKYRAKRIKVNEIVFPSLKEGRRYSKLAFLETKTIISDLELQPAYPFALPGQKPFAKYIADFRYKYEGQRVTEDTKGKMTAVFKLKMKLLQAFYPEEKLVVL